MDLCAKRYASPFSLLDIYIEMGRLDEFVIQVWDVYEEDKIFEIWLHKVDGKSFESFRESVMPTRIEPITSEMVTVTVKESRSILDGFSPDRR